ncbi:hypothetical protein [Flavobacterium reichenbachii]|uniref:DUF5018 domain-containing protein n=1 Tax=Flavobacterium reichenbachii TaxID=362418 RepID=A0A085ZI64_9FLAO|nr:hypothetical protein [Flavobacterium reichenbachii]KFF04128.1 hypothetical protein IW19_00665 [Flavobacterium reichenbachii]OXB15831.1 hypothetical protein B0A68_09200 [Flavobacterium reichenbachii]
MNTKIITLKTLLFFTAFAFFGLLTSCDNEEERWTDVKEDPVTEIITDLDARRIISFKVTNPGEAQAIYSAVNNLEKTITVYLPSYYEYQYLETAIALPEKTTISPAATELIPVFSKTPVTYTTKAADGTTAVYTVKIVIQQPKIILNELSTATSTYTVQAGGSITVKGENFVPSYEVTKMFIVDAQGNKKLQMKQYNDGLDIASFYITYSFGAIDTGLQTDTDYWILIESYNLSATMKLPFRIR